MWEGWGGDVWIAVSRQGTEKPQAAHKIQTFLSTLVKCNRLKAELASCEYERLSTCMHTIIYTMLDT